MALLTVEQIAAINAMVDSMNSYVNIIVTNRDQISNAVSMDTDIGDGTITLACVDAAQARALAAAADLVTLLTPA